VRPFRALVEAIEVGYLEPLSGVSGKDMLRAYSRDYPPAQP
jgi:hypothetical protein